ncbi:hypothetical protein CP10139811_0488 [Chlamydia ibidis]|uniref:Uncharacterized protein n=2 Tax=Chlamydia ibidis TaxID=1405396 RepID=S7J356_9CHLA|nr:hypothetical protein CP10139811_0488 [Chlamydia ibidis]EQM62384.1 hypothetical protein H359_0867 [Chlamydia ibidis 10-1398/6]
METSHTSRQEAQDLRAFLKEKQLKSLDNLGNQSDLDHQ